MKKLISMVLVLLLLCAVLPTAVFAAEGDTVESFTYCAGNQHTFSYADGVITCTDCDYTQTADLSVSIAQITADHNSATVTVNANPAVTGYELYVMDDNGEFSVLADMESALEYTHTGLTTGKTYTYKVKAYLSVYGIFVGGDLSEA